MFEDVGQGQVVLDEAFLHAIVLLFREILVDKIFRFPTKSAGLVG